MTMEALHPHWGRAAGLTLVRMAICNGRADSAAAFKVIADGPDKSTVNNLIEVTTSLAEIIAAMLLSGTSDRAAADLAVGQLLEPLIGQTE